MNWKIEDGLKPAYTDPCPGPNGPYYSACELEGFERDGWYIAPVAWMKPVRKVFEECGGTWYIEGECTGVSAEWCDGPIWDTVEECISDLEAAGFADESYLKWTDTQSGFPILEPSCPYGVWGYDGEDETPDIDIDDSLFDGDEVKPDVAEDYIYGVHLGWWHIGDGE